MKTEELITYFKVKDDLKGKTAKFNIADHECKKGFFERKFGTNISCTQYCSVVTSNGSEDEKIDTFYSSSLQSLLFFSGVSEKNPLVYRDVTYTKVCFEWKNPVLQSPSCVDVVLIGKTKTGKTAILFIESKLFEIVRDSDKVGKCVVGSTYFTGARGYKKLLKLEDKDFSALGIDKDDQDGKKRSRITPIPDGGEKYVYSYGIKQLFSHVIGILNFIKTPASVKELNQGIEQFPENVSDCEIAFLTLINDLPGFTAFDARQKIEDFEEHYKKAIEVLKQKLVETRLKFVGNGGSGIATYQDFYQEISKNVAGTPAYTLSSRIKEYYHLGE